MSYADEKHSELVFRPQPGVIERGPPLPVLEWRISSSRPARPILQDADLNCRFSIPPNPRKVLDIAVNHEATTTYRRLTTRHCSRHYTSVKHNIVALTTAPPTSYDAANRAHGNREKSKGGRKFVFGPIRKTPQQRNPLSHNTFRQTATPGNPEISILEQETVSKP